MLPKPKSCLNSAELGYLLQKPVREQEQGAAGKDNSPWKWSLGLKVPLHHCCQAPFSSSCPANTSADHRLRVDENLFSQGDKELTEDWSGQLKMSAELLQILWNLKRHHGAAHGSFLVLPGSGDSKHLGDCTSTKHSHSSHCLVVWNGWDFEVWNCKLLLHRASKIWVCRGVRFPFSFWRGSEFQSTTFLLHSCHCPLNSRAHSPNPELHLKNCALLFTSHEQGGEKNRKIGLPSLSLIPCKPLTFLSRAERNYLLYFYVPASNE